MHALHRSTGSKIKSSLFRLSEVCHDAGRKVRMTLGDSGVGNIHKEEYLLCRIYVLNLHTYPLNIGYSSEYCPLSVHVFTHNSSTQDSVVTNRKIRPNNK